MSASGETRLYIDPKCKHLIDSLEKVIYKPGSRDMDKSGGIEHSADALGYPVHRRYPVKSCYSWWLKISKYLPIMEEKQMELTDKQIKDLVARRHPEYIKKRALGFPRQHIRWRACLVR